MVNNHEYTLFLKYVPTCGSIYYHFYLSNSMWGTVNTVVRNYSFQYTSSWSLIAVKDFPQGHLSLMDGDKLGKGEHFHIIACAWIIHVCDYAAMWGLPILCHCLSTGNAVVISSSTFFPCVAQGNIFRFGLITLLTNGSIALTLLEKMVFWCSL